MTQNLVEILLVGNMAHGLLQNALRISYPDIPVEAVSDTSQALDYIFAMGRFANRAFYGVPSAILLDLSALLDDIEALDAIKAFARMQAIPVLAFVQSAQERREIETHLPGIDGYIDRSGDLETLCTALENALPQWLVTHPEPLLNIEDKNPKAIRG